MKNKASIFRVLLSGFIVLSFICTFLPMLTVEVVGTEASVRFWDLLYSEELYELSMILMIQENVLYIVRFTVILHLILNVFIVVLAWIKKEVTALIALFFGLVQFGWWNFCVGVCKTVFSDGNNYYDVRIGMGLWGYLDVAFCIVVLCVLILVLNKDIRGKKMKNNTVTGIKNVKETMLLCTMGEYAGAEIHVCENPIFLGRDKKKCQLVFVADKVSRQHCSIAYDKKKNVYKVVDFSCNGTFLKDGTRLTPNQVNELQPGTEFRIDENNFFVLK